MEIKLKDMLLSIWRGIKIIMIFIIVVIGLRGIVDIVVIFTKMNTKLKIDSLPSNNGNLYHIWSSSNEEFASHFLFIKNLSIPIDTMTYLDLLNTCLVYTDTVPPSHYKQLRVKKIIVLKSMDGWVEMRGHDHQDWEKIGRNQIVIIERKEDSILETRYRYENGNRWKHRTYKTLKNVRGNYTFENIK